jgi:hypothetical protein
MRARIQIAVDGVEGKTHEHQLAEAIRSAEELAKKLGDVEVEVLHGAQMVAVFSPERDAALAEMLDYRNLPRLAAAVRADATLAGELRKFQRVLWNCGAKLAEVLSQSVEGQRVPALLRMAATSPDHPVKYSKGFKELLGKLAELSE